MRRLPRILCLACFGLCAGTWVNSYPGRAIYRDERRGWIGVGVREGWLYVDAFVHPLEPQKEGVWAFEDNNAGIIRRLRLRVAPGGLNLASESDGQWSLEPVLKILRYSLYGKEALPQ